MKAWQEQHLRRLLETAASANNDSIDHHNPQLQQQMVVLARDFCRAVQNEASEANSPAPPRTTLRVVDDMLAEMHSKMAPMQREVAALERTRKALLDQASTVDENGKEQKDQTDGNVDAASGEIVDALSVSDLGTEPESMDLESLHTRATILRSRQDAMETKNYRSEPVRLAGRRRNQASGEGSGEEQMSCKRRKISI